MKPTLQKSKAIRLTGGGRGAVASIRIDHFSIDQTNDLALFQPASGRPLSDTPLNVLAFGYWGRVQEEVVACRVTDHSVELHCHGGRAAVDRIMNDLQNAGCPITCDDSQDEKTTADQIDWATEIETALGHALTFKTARYLLQQQTAWPDFLNRLAESDDPEFWKSSLTNLLSHAKFGEHLTTPWRIVIAGRPNVGKSSLINALLGFDRSIVFDQPGTTRDVVTAETAFAGWPVCLSDTAGIRTGADELEAAGIEFAHAQLESAELRILLFDRSQPVTEFDIELAERWPDSLTVEHKSDLPGVWTEFKPRIDIAVSSVTGDGIPELIQAITVRLIPDVPPDGVCLPINEAQIQRLTAAISAVDAGELTTARSILGLA